MVLNLEPNEYADPPADTFTCHDCGDTFDMLHPFTGHFTEEGTFEHVRDTTRTTGYAVLNDSAACTPDEHRICYECSRKRDLADAAETGQLCAYVKPHNDLIYQRTWTHERVHREYVDAVTTWPGLPLNVGPIVTRSTWRSNFGDVRTAFMCKLPTGKPSPFSELDPPAGNTLEVWHGIAYAGDGGYCRLKRAKRQGAT